MKTITFPKLEGAISLTPQDHYFTSHPGYRNTKIEESVDVMVNKLN